ncbi:MAG: LytTR family transcriptional regulator DNA-binding domain-containing protein [Clostridia bacterium]|nr:LytTR family transcriptional regulator DNA-binding domain-containing protein [Clostridia bacterium]
MLIRIAVTVSDKEREEKLVLRLTGVSIVMKTEFDIALYSGEFDKLICNMQNIDILIADMSILREHKGELAQLYLKNTRCLPVLLGAQGESVNDYLLLRPVEYIDGAESIIPEDENNKIKRVCNIFVSLVNKGFEEKKDNGVLYITTRQDSYAIPKDSIIYCQSDLKYTVFVLDDGRLIRKLDKLQSIEEKYLWDFKRVHQSFLVNPKMISGVDKVKGEVVLSNGTRVPFSRKYATDIREWFNN